nr:uncharacterized protein LOC132428279 isoform X2 [Delphinus delphis]
MESNRPDSSEDDTGEALGQGESVTWFQRAVGEAFLLPPTKKCPGMIILYRGCQELPPASAVTSKNVSRRCQCPVGTPLLQRARQGRSWASWATWPQLQPLSSAPERQRRPRRQGHGTEGWRWRPAAAQTNTRILGRTGSCPPGDTGPADIQAGSRGQHLRVRPMVLSNRWSWLPLSSWFPFWEECQVQYSRSSKSSL